MLVLGHGALVCAYVVVVLTLLLLSLYSRWDWRVKLGFIVLSTAAWIGVYMALPAELGWPTDRDVPRRFTLLAVYIQDADSTTGRPGSVFFWASDMDPDADPRPRAYRLPLTPGYKSVFEEAQGKLRQNIPQEAEAEPDDDVHGVPADRLQLGQKSVKVQIRDLPPPGAPSKDTPR